MDINIPILIFTIITAGLTACLVKWAWRDRKPRVDIKIYLDYDNEDKNNLVTKVVFKLISINLPFKVTKAGFNVINKKPTGYQKRNQKRYLLDFEEIKLDTGNPYEFSYSLEKIKEIIGSESGWEIDSFFIENDFNQILDKTIFIF